MAKTTKEQKMAELEAARALMDEANEKIQQAAKLIKRNVNDVNFCALDAFEALPAGRVQNREYFGMVEVHLYSGIKRLAKVLEMDATAEKDYRGKESKDRLCLCAGGIKFFQIGEPSEKKISYKYK